MSINEKLALRVIDECSKMSNYALQKYIDGNFKKASALGAKNSNGAWAESKMYRDKAKIAIIEMDNRTS